MALSLCGVLKVAAIEKLIATEALQLLGKTKICFLRQKSNL